MYVYMYTIYVGFGSRPLGFNFMRVHLLSEERLFSSSQTITDSHYWENGSLKGFAVIGSVSIILIHPS